MQQTNSTNWVAEMHGMSDAVAIASMEDDTKKQPTEALSRTMKLSKTINNARSSNQANSQN